MQLYAAGLVTFGNVRNVWERARRPTFGNVRRTFGNVRRPYRAFGNVRRPAFWKYWDHTVTFLGTRAERFWERAPRHFCVLETGAAERLGT